MTRPHALLSMPGHLIRRLNQYANAIYAEALRQAGLDLTSVQFAALAMMQEHPALDQTALSALIGADRATIGSVLRRLEEKTLIERRPNVEDRRAIQLFLTAQGEEMLARATPAVAAAQKLMVENLTPEETQMFLHLSRKLLGQL